jgi:hypothetical protein
LRPLKLSGDYRSARPPASKKLPPNCANWKTIN